jgi:hypothetical protein
VSFILTLVRVVMLSGNSTTYHLVTNEQ